MNLINTLHNLITPSVVIDENSPTHLSHDQKTTALSSLYALLGTWLHDKANSPLASLQDTPNLETLTQFFSDQKFTPVYDTLAQHHALAGSDVQALASIALPKAYAELHNLANGTPIATFLSQHTAAFSSLLPASLALTDVQTATAVPHGTPVAPSASPNPTNSGESPADTGLKKTFLPLIALLITGLVAWLLLKGCQKEPTAIATPTGVVAENKFPATLSLQFDETGKKLVGCAGVAHNQLLIEQIIGQINAAAPADVCQFHSTDGASDVPSMQYLPQIVSFAKGVPNARLDITGKTINLIGTDEASLNALKDKLAQALPADFEVNLNPIVKDTQAQTETETAVSPDTSATAKEASSPEQSTENNADSLIQNSLENAKTALETLSDDDSPEKVLEALNLQIINFAKSSADIPADNQAILDMAVKHLKDKDINITIAGHTDNRGNADGNKALSEARAKAVKDYLVAQGVNPKSLKVVGKGDAEPVADNETAEGRLKNRRIEFTLTK